jgi:acetolactate synthase-1/2/3 large subunit
MWAGQLAVRALKAEGVDTMFGLLGGHISPIQDFAYREGINVHQMRHEQAAVHAADGYARVTGRPGVCFATAGPGMLNMATGIHMAWMSRTPLVCLFGGHKEIESTRGSLQEAYAEKVMGSITKWTVRCSDPNMASYFIRKAFRDAMTPPYGPVAIEFPIDQFNWEPVDPCAQVSYLHWEWRKPRRTRPVAEADLIAEAVASIGGAKRPLIVAGEGLYWFEGGAALHQLAERTGTPFSLRRIGRGAASERHPLALSAGARAELLQNADLIVLVGIHLGYFESFGRWKTNARFIQINETPLHVLPSLPTEIEMIGDPGAILEQLVAALPVETTMSADRAAWGEKARDAQQTYLKGLEDEARSVASERPVHPRWLAKAIVDTLDPEATVVLDSFTGSTFLTDQMLATHPAHILEAGLSAAFGHGVGMGIGAQAGRPGKPVFVMMGDGGMGLGGGDIETAVRYGFPVVYLIYNDSTLCAGAERYALGKNFRVLGPNARSGFHLTDVRYDQMYAPLGCHVERVEDPADISGAIRRAFSSGKTAVIDVACSRDVIHPLYDSSNVKEMNWHLPKNEVEERARRTHHEKFYPYFHPLEPTPQ